MGKLGEVIDGRLLRVARDVNFSLPRESREEKVSCISDILKSKERLTFTKGEVKRALEEAEKTF